MEETAEEMERKERERESEKVKREKKYYVREHVWVGELTSI